MLIIKELRRRRGLTLDQMAEKTGFSKRSICQYEANEVDVPYLRLKKIAEVLNVNLQELDSEYGIEEYSQDSIPIHVRAWMTRLDYKIMQEDELNQQVIYNCKLLKKANKKNEEYFEFIRETKKSFDFFARSNEMLEERIKSLESMISKICSQKQS